MLRMLLGHGFKAEPARKPVAFCRLLRLAALATMVGLLSPASGAQTAEPADAIDRMLALVNGARADNGLMPLSLEPLLTTAACRQARDLSRGGPLTHQGRDGSDLGRRVTESGYAFALAAENLAAGAPSPEETVGLWLASPGHRRNILTAEFRDAGIAYQGPGQIWVLVFGVARRGPGALAARDLPQHVMVNGC